MAKQVQDIKVRLGIEGLNGLDRIKSSFRELGKVTDLSDKDIRRARQSLIDFASSAGNTEQTTKGLLEALKGLQGQTQRGSTTYQKLSKDILGLNESLRLTDQEISKQFELLSKSARSHAKSEAAIKGHVKALQDLRTQASLGGQAYGQIGAEIDRLNTKLDEGTKKNRSYRSVLGRALPADAEKLSTALEQLRQTLSDAGNTAEQTGRAMAQLAVGGATESRQRIVAFTKEVENQRLALKRLEEEFLDLPRTPAIYSQRLTELNLELNNTVIASKRYYEILADISTLQLELQQAQSIGRGQILFERLSLPEGVASRLASTQRNLGMVIGALREEMSMLDTSTAEGSAKFAQQSRQVAQLEEQLKKLNNQYTNVTQSQAAASQAGINPFLPSGAANPLFGEDIAREAVEGVKEFRKTYSDTLDSLISAKQTFREREAQLIQQNNQEEEEASRAQIARLKAEAEAADRAFMEQLNLRSDLLGVQQRAAASAMGLGGRDLSPLYQRITGLAGASVQREQLMMGRSATQVLTDMLTAFEKGGRGVDIKNKSTEIGESIAQGIAKGASDKSILISGANNLSDRFISSLKKAFRIKSPSGESRDEIGVPIGQGIGKGIVKGLKEVRGEVLSAVRVLFSDIAATPQRAALPAQETALADKLQSFLARTSAKTSTFLPFARLMGEEAVSSPALTLATYRKAYERGEIVPPMYMPVERRRNVRGVSGIPGYGLEQEIVAGAIRNVGRTGAFVGPLSGPQASQLGARSAFSSLQAAGFSAAPFAGQMAPLFGASSPIRARGAFRYGMAPPEAFPIEGMLGQDRTLTFGRKEAGLSMKEAISSYRKAIGNFWEGETGTFETIRRIVSSGVQLSASKLARRLTESVELPSISGVAGRIRGAMPSMSGLRAALPNVSIPGLAAFDEFLTGSEAFERQFNVIEGAVGASRLRGFPVSGMAQIGNVASGGGSFVPLAGGGGMGGGVRPPAGVVPPAAPSEYEKLISAVNRFGDVSRRSTADLRDFSGSLRLLQDILDPTAADFKQVNQEIEKQGRLVDRELEKRQRGGRRRMTGMQMAQAAGAALSGGIFGGPEGFLGGAIGTAVGGVGGAFAGAAIGAQIGGLRKQLGGFADYAAQIQKMEIALKNAAGGQAEFNQAVAAAASATQNLNVPQDIAIQGMTKLTAAVKGAGGQVTDAELVFRNVTSAIKATGGSAEDVDGAITAMVQVFSKGKVSAEELSGQLGERLPGAVTKFAKANDMTLPELQKALEQGQVGLNELMNFIVQLGDEYSGVAEKIAGSSQDAGARLTVAYNNMRIAVGEALQPIGAAFQEAFIPFIEGVTPVLVATLPKIGELMLAIAKNFDTAAVAVGVFMAALAISKVGAAVTALGGIPTVLGLIKVQAIAATGAIQALNLAALVNPWTALAAGVAAVAVAFYDAHKEKQRLDAVMESGSLDQLEAEIKRLEKSIADSESRARGYASELRGVGQDSGYANIELKKTKELLESFKAEYRIRFFIEQTFAGAKGVPQGMRIINGQLAYQVPGQGWVNAQTGEPIKQAATTEFPSLTGDGDRASKAKSEADKAAREAQRAFDERLQKMLQEEDHTLKKFALEEKIRLEREKQGAIQAGTLDSEMQLAEIANQRLDLDVRATALASENAKLEELRKQGLAEGLDVQKIAQKMQQNIIEDLAIQYENQKLNTQEIKAQIDLEKERENLNRALNQELQDRRYELGLITKEEYNRLQIERERRRLEEQYRGLPGAQGRIEEGVDLFRREIDPTFAEGLQSQLAIVRRELDELTKPINQVVGAATAIGDAFSQSFASVINGSATTQEALASFFQNLANYFLDMAAQIIQKMIVMAILNQIVKLLPGGSGGGLGGLAKGFSGSTSYAGGVATDAFKTGTTGIAGNYFPSATSFQPFAMGGIVNKPTLFKYADGGSGRFGLMGEAGPEAIIPLKRGRDGKLGVAGGGGVNVTVNVDAQGTKVQGDNNQGQQLGRAVAAAVQQELIKQKRPGGLLA